MSPDVSLIVEDLASFLSTQPESDELQIQVQKQTSKRKSTGDDSMLLLEVLLGKERLYYQNDNNSSPNSAAIPLEDKESILEDIQDALAERNWIRVQGQRIRPPQ